MIVNFYLKEDAGIPEDSVTITIMRNKSTQRSQMMNSISFEKLSDADRSIINAALALLEKHSHQEDGAVEIKYSL